MDSLEHAAVIATPDQRLRVFVSSTLQELAEERQAVKKAVQELRLTPVMFELGARPHAPRDLYRAYLEQSHIFVGVYWQRYGWVAPEETISGLEDEYRLSGNRPKLIYIKTPAPEREERLTDLLKRIQADDKASYKPFSSARELQRLLEDDLALLLTERFEQASARQAEGRAALPLGLPAPPSPIVGRERELEAAGALFERGARLVTLTGPGGIGKTRLALELAQRLAAGGSEVAFVPLASLHDPAQVAPSIGRVLGIRSTPGADPLEALEEVCRGECDPDLLDTLTSLVDKSLVEQLETDLDVRFVMLETIRAYAAEKLSLLPEAETLRQRHAEIHLSLAERAAPDLRNFEQQQWLERLAALTSAPQAARA